MTLILRDNNIIMLQSKGSTASGFIEVTWGVVLLFF